VRPLARRPEVDDDVVDRDIDRLAGALDEVCAEPARLQLAGMGGDDDFVGPVLVDRILDRLQRIGVDDGAARGDPRLVEKVERPPKPPFRARAAAFRVDDEACPRRVLRRDNGDADRPLRGPLADGVDERLAGDRLVRDDEDVSRLANATAPSRARATRRGRRS
jgi:hypothetical protein